jgi:hypothetical protein
MVRPDCRGAREAHASVMESEATTTEADAVGMGKNEDDRIEWVNKLVFYMRVSSLGISIMALKGSLVLYGGLVSEVV